MAKIFIINDTSITGGVDATSDLGSTGVRWVRIYASGTATLGSLVMNGDIDLSTHNLITDTITGTKIATATSQKLGFFNAAPIVQPASTTDLRTLLINLGLLASGGATPLNLNGGALTVGNLTAGTSSLGNASVGDQVYSASWDGALTVPTKNAIYDKLQTIASDVLFDHFTDGTNSGTTETNLYNDTLIAGQLVNNGEKIIAQYGGSFVGDGTSTQRIRLYVSGTSQIFDTGALGVGVSTSFWDMRMTMIRESATVVRCSVAVDTSTTALAADAAYTRVTGITLADAQNIRLTGTAAGITGASNQITASLGYVQFVPAA